MKLKCLFASVAVASALFSGGAMAADGTINFIGNITANACTVTGAAQSGNVVNTSTTITMPNVSVGALSAVGVFSGHTPFSIHLTNCEATEELSNVYTAFTTTNPAVSDTSVMANTQTDGSGATGIGLAILNGDSFTQIDLNGGSNRDTVRMLPVAGSPGPMQLDYVAVYKVLALPVTPGGVTGQVSYTLAYN